jgi:hypothetical protein
VFLCWYLPVAFYNVFACDDYWFGTNVRVNGFWGNQQFYYFNWEGSYTHTFFASLPHVFHGSHMPFLGNLFSLSLLFGSLFFFLRTYTNLSVKKGLAYSLYFLSFLYLCTKGNAEIRFWICANVTYISEMSFLLIFFSLYHKLNKESSYLKWIFVTLCLFLIGGSKLTFIIYAVSGIIIHDILYNKPVNKNTLLVWSLLGAFVILNVAAPGNYIRLVEETMPNDTNIHMNIVESVFYRMTEMEPFLLDTLFLLPIAAQWTNTHTYSKKRVLAATVVLGAAFILDSVVMYICFNDSGPQRVYFVAEVFSALFVLFGLNHFYTSVLCNYYYTRPTMILLALMVVVSHLFLLFQVPRSIEYSEKARERDMYVMSCTNGDTIDISPLPDSYLMLSYFSNDVIWLEKIYLPYFQKENKFVLLRGNDVKK